MEKIDFIKNYIENELDKCDLVECWNDHNYDSTIYEMDRSNFKDFCDAEGYDVFDVLDFGEVSPTDSYFWMSPNGDVESFDNVYEHLDIDSDDDFIEWFADHRAENYITDSDMVGDFLYAYNEENDTEIDEDTCNEWLHSKEECYLLKNEWADLFDEFTEYLSTHLIDENKKLKQEVARLTEELNKTKAELASANERLDKFKAFLIAPTEDKTTEESN